MSHTETPWSNLASRTVRGLLVRKGLTHETLGERLRSAGSNETPRSIEGKLLRGSFQFSFFLQILSAAKSDHPAHWKRLVASASDWEDASAKILRLELANGGLPIDEIVRRLSDLGIISDSAVFERACTDGNFSLVLMLQLCLIVPFDEIDRLVDMSDIAAAARAQG